MKKILCLVACAFMLCSLFFTANAANELAGAKSYTLDSTQNGNINNDSINHVYKFKLGSAGTINIKLSAEMRKVDIKLYDEIGTQIWSDTPTWNSTTELISYSREVDLCKGAYYIAISRYYNSDEYYGDFDFEITHDSVYENFKETQNGSNNSIKDADRIECGSKYTGIIPINDSVDFYRFELLHSGKINVSLKANVKKMDITLFDENGIQLWQDTPVWNSVTEQISYERIVQLCAGTYYISMSCYYKSDEYYGDYDFELVETSVYESFKETQSGSDNTIKVANLVECGLKYVGHITINDKVDFYKFSLPQSGRLDIDFIANAKKMVINVYDASGTQLWQETPIWNSTTEKIGYQRYTHLCKGEYYISISNYYGSDEYYGDYELGLYFTFSNESFSEDQNGSNNKINEANLVTINQRYNGQIAWNDSTDFFRVSCSASPTFNITANMKKVVIKIYDINGKEVLSDTLSWNSSTEQITYNRETDFVAGIYFVCVTKYYNSNEYTGNYSFYLTDGGKVLDAPLVNSVITVKVNGSSVNFDQPPVLENGRTLVPLRAIFEALGADVQWDGSTQTAIATRGNVRITLQIGSTQLYVNGNAKTLDVPAKLINSRTLVPVRAISEAFGCKVEWIGSTQTALITEQ